MIEFEEYAKAQAAKNREEQYWRASNISQRHSYMAMEKGIPPIDLAVSSAEGIITYLDALGHIPDDLEVSPHIFARQVKQVARDAFGQQDIKRYRKGLF